MSHDLDEMTAEAHLSEDKAQRAMVDAARLADELRQEQETAMALERDKKLLEAQVKDAQNRVDEAGAGDCHGPGEGQEAARGAGEGRPEQGGRGWSRRLPWPWRGTRSCSRRR